MYLTTLPLAEAIGHVLCHNLADASGRKAFKKGQRVRADDLPALQALGYTTLRVAVLEAGDVHEDAAAARLGALLAGAGTQPSRAVTGRVNLLATQRGLFDLDVERLAAVNSVDGLTVATLPRFQVVAERTILATIKIIPYAVPETALLEAEAVLAGQRLMCVRPLRPLCVGVLLVGSANAEARVRSGVLPAVAERIADLGAVALPASYVELDAAAVAEALQIQRAEGAELLIIAGETSIMDRDDVIPNGVLAAGGRVLHYGAPVEPGNLLLLAELPSAAPNAAPLPVIGAPGCVRSRSTNVVDLILPRLLAGERIGKQEIVALGHGGLLV